MVRETKQTKGNRILRTITAILFLGIVISGITNVASAASTIYAQPKPYNQTTDGPLIEYTQPNENLVNRGNIKLPERPVPSISSILPIILPGSGDRGFWIANSSGILVMNDAQTDLNIPDAAIGTTIYAPVNMPAGNSCVETVTAHWYYTGMTGTLHGQGFWDHCGIDGSTGWQTFEIMDDFWKDKYVRNYNGEERYFTEVYNDGGCWAGLLYNFNEGRWETKITPICSSSGFSDGWTMWESHYLMDQAKICPSFPNIRASDIQVLTNNGWIYLDTNSNLGPYGLCWENGKYQLTGISSDWTAMTLTGTISGTVRSG